ncbi:MAG: GGDEF domain-containing protein [Magnetococcales bacterium]|nr:GGDEF domain-containing protein [Magnetococcales bacterium]
MQLTDQTLAEQLKLTDRRIAERRKLFNITEEDKRNLLSAKAFVAESMDQIITTFYDRLLSFSDIQLVIGDADTLLRLQNTLRNYIQELFSGSYDDLYVNSRLRVGKVHKRIGVPPSLYMSAVCYLLEVLQQVLEDQCKDGACSRIEAEARKQSLSKVLMFDVHLIFETYTGALVAEVTVAQQELESYAQDLEQTVALRTQELKDLSRQDGLTGLLNQRAFYEHLRSDLAHVKRRKEPLTLAYFDLNGFKKLNDQQGHQVGDLVLAHVGECLLATVRDVDTSCRYGGDEFCIILPGSTDQEAQEVCRRLVDRFDAKAGEYGVSFSVGLIQTGPEQFLSVDDMVKSADERMYQAKAASKKTPGYWVSNSDQEASMILEKMARSDELQPLPSLPQESQGEA